MEQKNHADVSHLALVQNNDPRVLVVLLLHFVFGIYARPLHLKEGKLNVIFLSSV